jgi:xanthosine utilization system XapX-like protein
MSLRSEFLSGLCEEHGSELAFLYAQRVRVMDQPLAQGSLLQALEERIEAHAAALVVEPEPVEAMAQQWLAADDPGLRYAGLRALAGPLPSNGYWEAFAATPWDHGAHARAATDALIAVATPGWTPAIAEQLARSQGASAVALASAAVVHGLPVGASLEAAACKETTHPPGLLWALGQIGHAPATGFLYAQLQTGTPAARQSAAIALLRIEGAQQILPWLMSLLDKEAWVVLPLALCGSPRAVTALLQRAPTPVTDADWLMALGLTGHPSSCEHLLSALTQESVAGAAAAGLQLLTGAGLLEEVVILDEETLDPKELAELRAGRLDPKRVGTVHRRLSRDVKTWRDWLHARRGLFVAGQRYRHGRPFSIAAALPGLMSEWLPRAWRDLQAQELEIQARLHIGYSSELPVSEQQRRLAEALAAVPASARQEAAPPPQPNLARSPYATR